MSYDSAKAAFAEWGVDTEAAMARLATIAISVHCWQGDDVVGFEGQSGTSGGGIQATGNHPGRARTPDELRADLDFAFAMIPGRHRLNLHAMYMDTTETQIATQSPMTTLCRGSIGRGIRGLGSTSTRRSLPMPRPTTI